MPIYVLKTRVSNTAAPQAVGAEAGLTIAVPEMVGRSCRLEGYDKRDIPSYEVDKKIIAYASPDSTYAVTKKLIDAADHTILIGIYDFTAAYMQEMLMAAMARGVKVSLMLDIDGKGESEMFDDMVAMGVRGVSAPSCANATVRVFRSSHEKVIVIDGEWVLVQSGNYSANSIPLNVKDGVGGRGFRTGNRDTGLAIESRELAAFFTDILESDMALVDAVPEMLRKPAEEDFFLVERAPRHMPAQFFPSHSFDLDAPLVVQPVMSPDNYMDVMPDLIAQARSSVLIEQQYIRSGQPNIQKLLDAIVTARKAAPDLDVRIVLGKLFGPDDVRKEKINLQRLADDYDLHLGDNIRFINTDQFVHCHNKLIVIDGTSVLVSSQNWSDAAVTENREAGVWLTHNGIAGYFEAIFEHDWEHAIQELPDFEGRPEVMTPQSLGAGRFIRVEKGDYEEV